jgi:hypothetical protein
VLPAVVMWRLLLLASRVKTCCWPAYIGHPPVASCIVLPCIRSLSCLKSPVAFCCVAIVLCQHVPPVLH